MVSAWLLLPKTHYMISASTTRPGYGTREEDACACMLLYVRVSAYSYGCTNVEVLLAEWI